VSALTLLVFNHHADALRFTRSILVACGTASSAGQLRMKGRTAPCDTPRNHPVPFGEYVRRQVQRARARQPTPCPCPSRPLAWRLVSTLCELLHRQSLGSSTLGNLTASQCRPFRSDQLCALWYRRLRRCVPPLTSHRLHVLDLGGGRGRCSPQPQATVGTVGDTAPPGSSLSRPGSGFPSVGPLRPARRPGFLPRPTTPLTVQMPCPRRPCARAPRSRSAGGKANPFRHKLFAGPQKQESDPRAS